MAVITEDALQKLYESGKLKDGFSLKEGDILTPSARDFLSKHEISVKNSEFETIFGFSLPEKPENMTHLYGNFLVPKSHLRIRLRGEIDSLESEIIMLQILAKEENLDVLVTDLEEIIGLLRKIIRCEVKDEPLPEIRLQGLNDKELRAHSHHPSKYYGISHFLPSHSDGKIVASLNRLRTLARKVEICAVLAFEDEFYKLKRQDIIMALNRLSSLFWIMMFKFLSGKYGGDAK